MGFTTEEAATWQTRMWATPPTATDECSVLKDGRRLDCAEKVLAWLVEIEQMTIEEADAFLMAHRRATPIG